MKSITALAFVSLTLVCVPAAYADSFGNGSNTFDIEFVTVGNPGNIGDTTGSPNPVGRVRHVYRIGQHEVSREMVAKANTAGSLGLSMDPMTMLTDSPRPEIPATGLSWNEAARFVNWLNTSKGLPPAYKFSNQPGDVGYIANSDILLWGPGDIGFDASNPVRNKLAYYILPSVDEWYKAAYYDPHDGVYFNYPTGSDTPPTPVASGTVSGTAVHFQPFSQGPGVITQAGGLSPYGVMGMGGNVYEFGETATEQKNSNGSSYRNVRGGDWYASHDDAFTLSASVRFASDPLVEEYFIGFRVASIPEPSTLLLVAMTGLGLLLPQRPPARDFRWAISSKCGSETNRINRVL